MRWYPQLKAALEGDDVHAAFISSRLSKDEADAHERVAICIVKRKSMLRFFLPMFSVLVTGGESVGNRNNGNMPEYWRALDVVGQAALAASVEERIAAAIASQTDDDLITGDNYEASVGKRSS